MPAYPPLPNQTRRRPASQVLTYASIESIGDAIRSGSTTTPASAVWPTANLAIGIPFVFQEPAIAKVLGWWNGATASGNVDCGIYQGTTRLVSTGSTAQTGTSTIQQVDITDAYLSPDTLYYLVLAMDNTTGTTTRIAPSVGALLAAMGVVSATSSFPLPDPITWAQTSTAYLPVVALSTRTLL